MAKLKTYREIFTAGKRVRVKCHPQETGTDTELEGCTGTIVRQGMWILVEFDSRPKHWPKQACICPHNLKLI